MRARVAGGSGVGRVSSSPPSRCTAASTSLPSACRLHCGLVAFALYRGAGGTGPAPATSGPESDMMRSALLGASRSMRSSGSLIFSRHPRRYRRPVPRAAVPRGSAHARDRVLPLRRTARCHSHSGTSQRSRSGTGPAGLAATRVLHRRRVPRRCAHGQGRAVRKAAPSVLGRPAHGHLSCGAGAVSKVGVAH
jgi:hypothetical protein